MITDKRNWLIYAVSNFNTHHEATGVEMPGILAKSDIALNMPYQKSHRTAHSPTTASKVWGSSTRSYRGEYHTCNI